MKHYWAAAFAALVMTVSCTPKQPVTVRGASHTGTTAPAPTAEVEMLLINETERTIDVYRSGEVPKRIATAAAGQKVLVFVPFFSEGPEFRVRFEAAPHGGGIAMLTEAQTVRKGERIIWVLQDPLPDSRIIVGPAPR